MIAEREVVGGNSFWEITKNEGNGNLTTSAGLTSALQTRRLSSPHRGVILFFHL